METEKAGSPQRTGFQFVELRGIEPLTFSYQLIFTLPYFLRKKPLIVHMFYRCPIGR
ncbi:hypothetical protein [Salininema proteolyticum]|uniref:Uncharacterized protein n=1 Tax=Salininema proteolyticum TaxID=1607685 RepID=A0ABV8TYZ0_9ACTN